jgi:hypothetical protein
VNGAFFRKTLKTSELPSKAMFRGQPFPLTTSLMENHIKLTSGFHTNSYLRQFQVAQLNFYLFLEEEKKNKKGHRAPRPLEKAHEPR